MDTWCRRIRDLHVWMEVGLPSGDGGMSSFIFMSHIGRGGMFRILTIWYECVVRALHACRLTPSSAAVCSMSMYRAWKT
jgi:hypothetical protein